MGDANDDAQNVALGVLAGVVALVIAGVIALAGATSLGRSAPAIPVASASTATPLGTLEAVYFEPGSAALSAEAQAVLARVADAARTNAGATVVVSGFHDASGDPGRNAELARQRAVAVRHALEANGVAPASLVLDRPAVVQGGADAQAARRVEVRVQ
jgi:outer membrane protein OmpA-like peptidoglycan-associated protein